MSLSVVTWRYSRHLLIFCTVAAPFWYICWASSIWKESLFRWGLGVHTSGTRMLILFSARNSQVRVIHVVVMYFPHFAQSVSNQGTSFCVPLNITVSARERVCTVCIEFGKFDL